MLRPKRGWLRPWNWGYLANPSWTWKDYLRKLMRHKPDCHCSAVTDAFNIWNPETPELVWLLSVKRLWLLSVDKLRPQMVSSDPGDEYITCWTTPKSSSSSSCSKSGGLARTVWPQLAYTYGASWGPALLTVGGWFAFVLFYKQRNRAFLILWHMELHEG